MGTNLIGKEDKPKIKQGSKNGIDNRFDIMDDSVQSFAAPRYGTRIVCRFPNWLVYKRFPGKLPTWIKHACSNPSKLLKPCYLWTFAENSLQPTAARTKINKFPLKIKNLPFRTIGFEGSCSRIPCSSPYPSRRREHMVHQKHHFPITTLCRSQIAERPQIFGD